MFPRENEPLMMAVANARLVAPPKLAAVHCVYMSAYASKCSASWLYYIAYTVEEGQRSDNCVDKIDTGKNSSSVASRQEGHQCATDDATKRSVFCQWALLNIVAIEDLRRNDAAENPCPAMRARAYTKPDKKCKEDANGTGWHVHQSSTLRIESQIENQR